MGPATVTFRVRRHHPQRGFEGYSVHDVPVREGMTVLEGLWHIVEFIDGSVSFRYSCRGAVCGSCAMRINGTICLACETQIARLLPGPVTVEPLPYFPLIKDLVVDMEPFLEKYRSLRPFFPEVPAHEKEQLQTPEERARIDPAVNCILCAACHSACPLAAMDDTYLGPAALTAAQRFAFDSRNPEGLSRLTEINDLGEFRGCMQIARCTKVCPKCIVPSDRIEEIRRYLESSAPTEGRRTVRTVCGYCSTGCGLTVHVEDEEPVELTTTEDYPVNRGRACPKGWEALTPLKAADRATTPSLRDTHGKMQRVDWDTALNVFTQRFKAIQEQHGKEAAAFLSTGQIPIEEMAFLGCLARFGMGVLHADGNTRQCMATAATAYKQSFGFDAPPYSYKDLEQSDLLIFIGANPVIAHPIMWERMAFAMRKRRTIVIDPRKTDTARQAHRHYAIKPKSDPDLLYALANVLIEKGWVEPEFIARHTTGFEEFQAHVKPFTPEKVSKVTGIGAGEILELAEMIHAAERASFWWTMGVNQSHMGVRTAQAIINLALITGNIGRPGTGPNSITGQANAMGSRLFSNTTCLLGGHDFANPQHREKIANILGIAAARVPHTSGCAYDQIVDRIATGEVKGLWIIATNPAHSWINQSALRGVLGNLEFLVAQDAYHSTETARSADLILPGACWGEKEGTFINSERRIARVARVAKPPGAALPDFEIFQRVASAWGCGDLFEAWTTPEAVFHILKKASAGTPCDITGIRDYRMLEERGGIQWPFPAEGEPAEQERRLFEDGKFFHPDGRARLLFAPPEPLPEPPSAAYPFLLLTGRGTVAQWHTQTRTGKSEALRKLYPDQPYLELNPEDAERLHIHHHDWVLVASPRAEVRVMACITTDVQPGQLFMPMHYEETNKLTFPAFDPHSRQPAYKACAAAVCPLPPA